MIPGSENAALKWEIRLIRQVKLKIIAYNKPTPLNGIPILTSFNKLSTRKELVLNLGLIIPIKYAQIITDKISKTK